MDESITAPPPATVVPKDRHDEGADAGERRERREAEERAESGPALSCELPTPEDIRHINARLRSKNLALGLRLHLHQGLLFLQIVEKSGKGTPRKFRRLDPEEFALLAAHLLSNSGIRVDQKA